MTNGRAANTRHLSPETMRPAADPPHDVRRPATQTFSFAPTSRIASGDRNLSTAGRIVGLGPSGATVEVMFPSRGPAVIMLFDHRSDQVYECEVRWQTEEFIGVRFLDILGPVRRRLFFADQPVPLRSLPNQIMKLVARPREENSSYSEPQWRAADAQAPRRSAGQKASGPGPLLWRSAS